MGFNIKLKTVIKSTVNTSPQENKVKNPHRSQTLKFINYTVIQSLKVCTKSLTGDLHLKASKRGKMPSKSRRRNFYASSDRSHCTPPKRGKKIG